MGQRKIERSNKWDPHGELYLRNSFLGDEIYMNINFTLKPNEVCFKGYRCNSLQFKISGNNKMIFIRCGKDTKNRYVKS